MRHTVRHCNPSPLHTLLVYIAVVEAIIVIVIVVQVVGILVVDRHRLYKSQHDSCRV